MKTTKLMLAAALVVGALSVTIPAFGVPYSAPLVVDDAKKDKALDGKIEAINFDEKSFTLGGKTVHTTDTTKFTKGKQTILLSDLKVGDEVHAMTHDTFDGKVEATSVDLLGRK